MTPFFLREGATPLVISVPHAGTAIPAALRARMTDAALALGDTDWFVDALYAPIAEALDATLIAAHWSRYVIDLNRPADGAALYPGQSETGLLPLESFDGESLYREGQAPDAIEREARIAAYWRPYHVALAHALAQARSQHGAALLWDGHSIAAEVPKFFTGRLPDLNVGTFAGVSAAPEIEAAVMAACRAQSTFSSVLNGRFKGGYITRHYGRPGQGVHAVQLEMNQDAYMVPNQAEFSMARAAPAIATLQSLVQAALGALPR
jgi:N-formylglutamate deformylase